jgi:hypothetical protein
MLFISKFHWFLRNLEIMKLSFRKDEKTTRRKEKRLANPSFFHTKCPGFFIRVYRRLPFLCKISKRR